MIGAAKLQAVKKGGDTSIAFLIKANRGIVDLTGGTTFDTANTAVLSATQHLYGSQSIQFAGNTTTQEISSAGTGGVVSGNWTMEAWIFVTTSATARQLMASTGIASGTSTFTFGVNSAYKVTLADSIVRATSNGALVANQWNHIALCKTSGGTATLYINGVADLTTAVFAGAYTTTGFAFGSLTTGGQPFLGFVDSARISRKIQYTGNFTPAEFPDI